MFISTPVIVDKYDLVELDYVVWESDETEAYDTLNPLFDAVVWVTMIPNTENDTTGLILGLYNNLLGKAKFYESGLTWLKNLNQKIAQIRKMYKPELKSIRKAFGGTRKGRKHICYRFEYKDEVYDLEIDEFGKYYLYTPLTTIKKEITNAFLQ